MANAADFKTNDSEFRGINETLAAGAREEQVPAGPCSSMKVFAMVLHEMAVRKDPISILSWQQHIIAKPPNEMFINFRYYSASQCAFRSNPVLELCRSMALSPAIFEPLTTYTFSLQVSDMT
ncbi:hypothetical protein RAB80_007376 [Fusarium oxysporum f. sp. vasinfectum]|nr:hypothetical protein RAB80_007376 [Fusarium oxysporum f. sp. vasinfectum]KAK2923576.1 hypothetical protein FoTM2_015733 [Fusarium oxysporum f. sp. vasinfectum]